MILLEVVVCSISVVLTVAEVDSDCCGPGVIVLVSCVLTVVVGSSVAVVVGDTVAVVVGSTVIVSSVSVGTHDTVYVVVMVLSGTEDWLLQL